MFYVHIEAITAAHAIITMLYYVYVSGNKMTVFTNKGPTCRLQAGIDYTKLDELTKKQYRTPVFIRLQSQDADIISIPAMSDLINRLDTFKSGTLVVISNVTVSLFIYH
jgi:hypothetical protein